jgi:hypothetical protein
MISFLYACLITLVAVFLFVGLFLGLAYLTIYLTKGMK